jgi:hypothetical protein
VRSGSGEAKTILLLYIIRARPSKQARMVGTFLKVHKRSRLSYATILHPWTLRLILNTAVLAVASQTFLFRPW